MHQHVDLPFPGIKQFQNLIKTENVLAVTITVVELIKWLT